ncbi:hypothetical protein ABTY59_36080 [Streptomyces sp. NPDC096079]|uniref:hypothetical protein n=1 Tax=Streptomyces sp. NPDC096079 TaxID=3155820 RepID=UPI00331E521A
MTENGRAAHRNAEEQRGNERSESPEGSEIASGDGLPPDRDSAMPSGLPGHPLTSLLFSCVAHGEDKAIEYYDPQDPPVCSHGDLMVRKAR